MTALANIRFDLEAWEDYKWLSAKFGCNRFVLALQKPNERLGRIPREIVVCYADHLDPDFMTAPQIGSRHIMFPFI
jgi:hypothetical protein